jgi:hypothetical protein
MFNKRRGYDGTAFSGEVDDTPPHSIRPLHFYDQKAKNLVANTL